MNKEYWKLKILDVIKRISDKGYQEKSWFGLDSSVSSIEELYCELFDDLMYDDFLELEDNGLTEDQKILGIQLKEKLNAYLEKNLSHHFSDPKQVINDRDWELIRECAKNFVKSVSI